jgi:hypothetical protein
MIHPYAHYPARAARRWPERLALVDGERRRSYRELDERATRLARAWSGWASRRASGWRSSGEPDRVRRDGDRHRAGREPWCRCWES